MRDFRFLDIFALFFSNELSTIKSLIERELIEKLYGTYLIAKNIVLFSKLAEQQCKYFLQLSKTIWQNYC